MVKTKILAMILAVAMIVAIVPSLALTASAAQTTDVINTIEGAEILWYMPDTAGWNDAPVSNIEGWNAVGANGNLISNDAGNYIQFYGPPNVTVTTPGYGGAADTLVLEAAFKRNTGINNTFYQKHTFYDIDGAEIGHAWIDWGTQETKLENPWGFPNDGAKVALVVENNKAENTHKNTWYVDGAVSYESEELEGIVNGFGSMTVGSAGAATSWWHMGYRNLTIAGVVPETAVNVKASYKVEGEEIDTATSAYDSAYSDGCTFPEKYYVVDGSDKIYYAEATTLSADGDINLEVVDNADVLGLKDGGLAYVDGTVYDVVSSNIIPNGDFSEGLLGWFNGTHTPATEDKFTVNGDGTISGTNSGHATEGGLSRSWPLEAGETYVFAYTDTSDGSTYHKISFADTLPAGNDSDGSVKLIDTSTAGTTSKVFTNTANNKYLRLCYRWMNPAEPFGNYGLYKVAEADDQTVPDGAEAIADITVIEGNDPLLPKTVKLTAKGEPYGVGTVTKWTAGEEDEEGAVTYTATVDTGIAFYELPEAVEVKVIVLPCDDDSLAGTIHSVNVGTDGVHKFTTPINGNASFEFDVTYNAESSKDAGGVGIFIGNTATATGKSGGIKGVPAFGWGGNAIGLQGATYTADDKQLNFREGKKFAIETGETYRVFVSANIENNTYSAVVRDSEGAIVVEEPELNFREGQGVLDSLAVVLYNTNISDVENAIIVENFRISWPDGVEYTVKAQYEGEDIEGFEPYTKKYIDDSYAATEKAPYIKGYIADGAPTVAENTITFNYVKVNAVDSMFSYRVVADQNGTLDETDGGYNVGPLTWGGKGVIVMAFDVPQVAEGEKLASATLNIYAPSVNNAGSTYATTVYVLNPEKADFEQDILVGEGYTVENWADLAEATEVYNNGSYKPVVGANSIAVDFSNAEVGEKLVLALVIGSHEMYVAGESYGEGAYIPYLTDVVTAEAPEGKPEVSLGWTGSEFAFLVKPGADVTAVVAYVDGAAVATAELGESDAVVISTDKTNAIFTFKNKNEVVGDEASEAYSIYSLVAEALEGWKAEDEIQDAQITAVNTVINAGGLYIKGDDLTPEAKMIFTYTAADSKIALNENLLASGIKLAGIKYAVGEGEAKDAEIAEDGKSATISVDAGEAGDQEVVIYLEEVEFTFETVDESVADETISGELDFVEEV